MATRLSEEWLFSVSYAALATVTQIVTFSQHVQQHVYILRRSVL